MLLHCYSCSLHWWDRPRADPRREPPRDPDRPARPRRLAEAVERLLDRGPGASWSPGRSTSSASRARSWSGTRWASRSRSRSPSRASQLVDRLVNIDEGPTSDDVLAAVPRQARLRAGDRRGDLAAEPGLRGQGRLRRRLRARLRDLRRLPEPRSGRRRLQRDDLHLVQASPRRRRGLRGRDAARPAPAPDPRCRCCRSSATRTRSATRRSSAGRLRGGPRRAGRDRSRAPATRPTSRSPTRPRS